jgi:hypothetical protein
MLENQFESPQKSMKLKIIFSKMFFSADHRHELVMTLVKNDVCVHSAKL